MAQCWRCGGGKTISVTTTGTHVLPCPTCAGWEPPRIRGTERSGTGDVWHAEATQSARPLSARPTPP